jgi:hypothetical protein
VLRDEFVHEPLTDPATTVFSIDDGVFDVRGHT